MIIKSKDSNMLIGHNLKLGEFACKCSGLHCRNVTIHSNWLQAWNKLRKKADTSIRIRSGHRCSLHNYDVGGVPLSRHITGEASDFDLDDLLKAFDNVTIIKKELYKCGFTFLLINEDLRYVHADTRGNHE